jgi:hypothetical protein
MDLLIELFGAVAAFVPPFAQVRQVRIEEPGPRHW